MEQPGKNALPHLCEMKVEMQDEHDQTVLITCGLVSILQCSECAAWVCGTEGLEHANICVRCDHVFCPEHYQSHKLSRDCEQKEVV